MAGKAPTQTTERLKSDTVDVGQKDQSQATVGQTDISSLKKSKSGVAQGMQDLARAQELLRTDFSGADWPQAKFALDQLAVLAVQYKSCLQGERLLFRSEINTLRPGSIARLYHLFMNLRRCRKDIQEEFTKISVALLRNRIRRDADQRSLPPTDFSTKTRDSHQKRSGTVTAASETDCWSAPKSGYAPPPD